MLECVPNFAEGQNKKTLSRITSCFENKRGVTLLHRDSNTDANRTVFTLVGERQHLLPALLKALEVACMDIDINNNTGPHPMVGALDVCPFVPLRDKTMQDAIDCARDFGERAASLFDIPVFLYGYAAASDYRQSLVDIRRGGAYGLQKRMRQQEWIPDFGPSRIHPTAGALAVGARNIMIAFNMTLNTDEIRAGWQLAAMLRESRKKEGPCGELANVMVMAWRMPKYGRIQISLNILENKPDSLWRIYNRVALAAIDLGLNVEGGEIVGLVPLSSMVSVAHHLTGDIEMTSEEGCAISADALQLHRHQIFNVRDKILWIS